MKECLEKKLEIIKNKLEAEDYDKFMNGDYDKNKMYKGLVEDVSEYGFDGELGDEAIYDEDDSSRAISR
jgi:hypothetical protein